MKISKEEALEYHSIERKGKIEVIASKPCLTSRDLSLAYTPGVAEPCREIHKNVEDVYKYTAKGNLVAVVSNGTAVLGLGDIGAEAGKPVMEGKGVLFKRFADIDVFDIELASHDSQEIIRTTRYVAGALAPNFQVNKYIGIGAYLFYTRGIEKYITRNTYMVSFRPSISNIPITKKIVARVGPEIYYLKMDDNDGVYLNATLLISRKNFPLSISALINTPTQSDIPSEYDFLWNVGMIYTFNKQYREVN